MQLRSTVADVQLHRPWEFLLKNTLCVFFNQVLHVWLYLSIYLISTVFLHIIWPTGDTQKQTEQPPNRKIEQPKNRPQKNCKGGIYKTRRSCCHLDGLGPWASISYVGALSLFFSFGQFQHRLRFSGMVRSHLCRKRTWAVFTLVRPNVFATLRK